MSFRNGHDDPHPPKPNVTSIADARRRAEEKAKAAKRAATPGGPSAIRDWIVGGVLIAMSIGTLVWYFLGTGGTAPPGGGTP